MEYLVTGGAGFIGSHLVDKLIDLNHKVVVLDNFSGGKRENLDQSLKSRNLEIIEGDIRDDLTSLFKNHDFQAVFHLAALPRVQFSIENPKLTHDVNVNGTLNLICACQDFGVERFVFSSSSSVYGDQDKMPLVETMRPDPISPYALHKFIGEKYLRLFNYLHDLKTISLRYFNVYGPRVDPEGAYALVIGKFIDLVKKGQDLTIFGDGEQTRDFTYVEDVVNANILAAQTENEDCFGQVFNIGAGQDVSINQLAEEIVDLSENDVEIERGPARVEPKHTLANMTKAKKMFGWTPQVTFEEGLKKTWQAFE